jgi:hypothetical protein
MLPLNRWSWSAPISALLLGMACRGEPASSRVAPAAVAAVAEPEPAPSPVVQPSALKPGASTSAAALLAPAPSASASGAIDPIAPGVADDPPLIGPDGSPLPQTEEKPSVNSERFRRRMKQLADSILTGDVERGRDAFFPLVAYAQVKDVQKPERDYRYRLMATFARDVREYHKALGKEPERAELLGVDVPEERAQWMKPGKEGNRLGYYRVLRSRLRFRLASGAEKSFELTSMISWRGEWYVVHLHGFE